MACFSQISKKMYEFRDNIFLFFIFTKYAMNYLQKDDLNLKE